MDLLLLFTGMFVCQRNNVLEKFYKFIKIKCYHMIDVLSLHSRFAIKHSSVLNRDPKLCVCIEVGRG